MGGEGEDDDEDDEDEEEEEEEEEDEEDEDEDYRQCTWRNTNASPQHTVGRLGGVGRGGGGMGGRVVGGGAMHEDSTATSFSDITLYLDEGCLPSSPLSRPPSSPLSRPASSSDTEYWGGGTGGGGGGVREDSRETEGGSSTSRRSSTPCTECRVEYRGRVGTGGGGGGGGGHLPVLTIEPPSDSSVDMSDR